MLSIIPHNLHWLSEPFEKDLCAHGGITVSLDDQVLVDQAAEDWSLSAAALMLLRTISRDHASDERVGEHLVPCCGHAMYTQDGSADVLIVECNNGVDWEVRHQDGVVELRFENGTEVTVSTREWRGAVLEFADAIAAFYDASAAKQPADELEAEGFEAFRVEWARRREAVAGD